MYGIFEDGPKATVSLLAKTDPQRSHAAPDGWPRVVQGLGEYRKLARFAATKMGAIVIFSVFMF